MGDDLYERVKAFEQTWLGGQVRPHILAVLSPSLLTGTGAGGQTFTANEKRSDGEKLLRALKSAWEDHNLCMSMTTDVLMYMDRVYCKDFRKPSIFAAAMGLFRECILSAPLQHGQDGDATMTHILNTVMLDQIRMDREGDMVDKQLLKSCVYMLEGLYETEEEDETSKLYLTSFEPAFLRASREFYKEEGAALLLEADAGTFCKHARRRVDEEQDRCRSTLSTLTQSKIQQVVDEELIRNHLHDVVGLPNSGVKSMLDNDRLSELEMIYDLSSRVDQQKMELRKAVQSRIYELGTELNKGAQSVVQPPQMKDLQADADAEKEPVGEKGSNDKAANQQAGSAIKWVDDVLLLKAKYDNVLAQAFQDDQGLQTAITRSFTDFINDFDRSSEHLSLFFDENMKKGIKGKTENEVDALLDRGITLLRYIQDKDMFERYYKKHLSKRLLMKRSVSMDAERQMISKMKMEVGNSFTNRIEAMFKDMAVSADLSANYKLHVKKLGDPDPHRAEIEVNVLTSTMWPLEAMAPQYQQGEKRPLCIFPSSISKIKQGFEKFYLDKHSGRQLTWQANMGTADIRAYFPETKGTKKTRELNVSTYAMIILMLFNDLPPGEHITCEEIQAQTNIPFSELTRNLQSLAVAPKTRVLLKQPMSKDVKLSDKFTFNESFHSSFQKVKIGVVTSANRVEDLKERNETEQKIDESRKAIIEAAVVRIMKYTSSLDEAL